MWFDTTKSAMKKLKVAYNNSLRRLLSLPTYTCTVRINIAYCRYGLNWVYLSILAVLSKHIISCCFIAEVWCDWGQHGERVLSWNWISPYSEMFAVLNIPSFGELLRKFAFSFVSRMSSSINVFMVNIYNSSVPLFSKIRGWWYSILTI